MAIPNRIWTRARSDLLVVEEPRCKDCVLLEHSARIARSAERIATELLVGRHEIDFPALAAAALYHDAGWIVQYRDAVVERMEILCKPTTTAQRQLGAAFLETRLAGILKPESLKLAVECVRRLNDRDFDCPEAQAIAEAENLDQVGSLSLWTMVRRHALEGKGLEHSLEVWQRRCEYHYWEAWIQDSFRLEPVRELARSRLAVFGRFMAELAELHASGDLDSLAGNPAPDVVMPPANPS